MAFKVLTIGTFQRIVVFMAISVSVEGAWRNLIGTWSDSGASWTGSIPYGDARWHYGPARLWTTPMNTDQYVITSRVQALNKGGCGHLFKYKTGSVRTRTKVTGAWGYYILGDSLRITSSGPEYSPMINFPISSGAWYNLKSEVNGSQVRIYVNDKLVKEITMLGSGADARSDNYVGLWCHSRISIKGDSFQVQAKCQKLSLGSGVHVSPSHCLWSSQNYGSTCSFSCARGYQLSGPPSTQCGRSGAWDRQINTVSCVATKCAALSVGRLVRTSPSNCVTSQMNINTNCTFSCPRGYKLEGPPYKQCGPRGQWTNSAKIVSCVDIDECSLTRNGGCSHKCVNTAGGYRCECPDPELSLASDNKTCHAAGVDVKCNSENMTIIIPKSVLRGVDHEHLRLLDTTCKATETSTHFFLGTPLAGCKTARRHTSTTIVYSNAVLEIPVNYDDVVTRVREIEIPFSCFYSKYGVVSTVSWKPSNRKLVFSDQGQGNFTLSLDMFPDKRFVSPYMKDDFPVAVVLRKLLFFEVSVASNDKQLSIVADRCFATPTQDQKNPLKYEFIRTGCPNDVTVKYHDAPSASAQRFSLEAFEFIADHPFVFVHCHVVVCNASDPSSKCARSCSPSDRQRREVNDHMTDDVYSLAQGPLHLTRQKREEKDGNSLKNGGSSLTAMVSLFVMSVACLAGTALMIFKKSRDKPIEYTVLATRD